jgi:hypothetical protein
LRAVFPCGQSHVFFTGIGAFINYLGSCVSVNSVVQFVLNFDKNFFVMGAFLL